MKKILTVITLAVMVLAVAPQVQAQDMKKLEALEKELEKLDKAVEKQGGQPTPAQVKRAQEIQEEVIKAAGPWADMVRQQMASPSWAASQNQDHDKMLQQSQQQQQRQQQYERDTQQANRQTQDQFPSGETAGWPSSSIFSQCNLPNLRQPSGTTVSYNYNSQHRSLEIFIRNGAQNHAADLARAIEAGGKVISKSVDGNDYYFTLQIPSGMSTGSGTFRIHSYQLHIQVKNGGIELGVGGSAG